MLNDWLRDYLDAQRRALDSVNPDEVADFIELLRQANAEDRQIFICGNGGSAANASHFATDLGKSASDQLTTPFRVLSLNESISWLTAIGNDYDFRDVFVRQLRNYAKAGDLLIVTTVSGNSPNVIAALEWAKQHGLVTAALTGAKRGRAADLVKHALVVNDTHYGRVEDVQMHILHMMCYAFVEKRVPVEYGKPNAPKMD